MSEQTDINLKQIIIIWKENIKKIYMISVGGPLDVFSAYLH